MNLLTDPLLTLSNGSKVSLPALFAAMAKGDVRGFPALRPHQRPAWHMFLVQLGALAFWGAKREDPPVDAADWRADLRRLTPDHPDDAPWRLVVKERDKPAFLQPPDPGGLRWAEVSTPDALDLLITSRNHDLKQSVARQANEEDWIFSLVSLQTSEGFGGRGNYGIARMNGGSSSRPMMGLAPEPTSGYVGRFFRLVGARRQEADQGARRGARDRNRSSWRIGTAVVSRLDGRRAARPT